MALVNTYSITYNGLGGTGVPSATTGQYSGNSGAYYTVYLRGGSPSKTGYNFLGWSESIGATSPSYQPGDSYSFQITGAPFSTVMYAAWQAKTYTVSYNKGSSGTGTNVSDTKTYGVDLTLRGAIFTRSGYEQDGWATSDGGATTYALGGTYTANATVTLYPHWKVLQSSISSVTSSVPADGSTQGTVSITRYNSSYTHKVTISLGSRSTTYTGVGTSKTFTIPAAWVDQIPSATSKTATVTITTWNGSTQIGGSDSKSFTVTVPSTVKPTVSISGTNQSDNSTVSGWNTLVQGYSKIKLTATAAAGTGSSITSIVFSGEGVSQSGTGTTVTSALLTTSGSKTWKVTVTDARGRTASASLTRTVYEYFATSISSLTAKRSNSSGTAAPADGTYINAKGTYTFASCNSHNSASVKKIEYKLHTASSWTTGQSSAASGTAYTFGGGNISILSTYDVRMTVTDALGSTATYTVNVSSVQGVSFGLNGQCARFGGPVQYSDRFECDWNAQFDGTVDVVNRRAEAYLSSAGWYNVIKFNISSETSVKFATAMLVNIRLGTTYNNTSNCVHEVTMLATYGTNPRFANELSRSNVNVIDKIRYRYDSNNIGWIDVHYTESSNNDVWMQFDLGSTPSLQKFWLSQNFVAVADAPSTGGTADTILTTYTFAENTVGAASLNASTSRGTITSGEAVYVGRMVHLNFVFTASATATNSPQIASAPPALYDSTLSAIDITSGMSTAITAAIPCGIGTTGRVFLKSITSGHIYAITGDYLV